MTARILDPSFRYVPASSHDDPALFRARMVEYGKPLPRKLFSLDPAVLEQLDNAAMQADYSRALYRLVDMPQDYDCNKPW